MTDPWMDGARTGDSGRIPRARLAVLLMIALTLPVVIVVLGSHAPQTTVEFASAPAAAATLVRATASPTTEATTTSDEVTTTEGVTTTDSALTSTTAAPTTATSPPTTAAKAATSTSKSTPPTTKAQAKVAPPATAAPAPPPTTAAPAPSPSQSAAAFLACVRQRESRGNYSVVSANGLYMGAYQFHQTTWDNSTALAGRPDLAGRKPNTVAPADQDAVALALYKAHGASPWGGACR